ncbi:MAG: DUF1858 domain-containing protein [Clostridiales bacterium]|nr:DUF1858 domain-containing protein [Clostridiales bacterium]HBM80277.1 disulfide oxidoreductase [Clostridiaceae bacterium]
MITKEMSITEIIEKHPETEEIFYKYGMYCLGCMAAMFESLEQGALAHGIDVDKFVEDLNKAVKK